MYFQIKGFKIKRTYTMQSTFKNLLYVLRHYKLATVTNLLGLSFAFLLFMLISIHVGHEYSFDASLLNRERIFQLEMTGYGRLISHVHNSSVSSPPPLI